MTRYLVLGGGGFIGRHVVRHLAETSANVKVVGRRPWNYSNLQVKSHCCDLANATPAQYDRIIESVDVIFHLAWTSIPATANLSPIEDLYHNGKMTLELLEALRRRGGGRLVFASSGGTVYGRLRTIPAGERHPLDPITAYGVSKLACEKYLHLYRYLYSVDARIARIANPYGAGQDPFRMQGAVSTFIFKALSGTPIDVWGTGDIIRDYIYIADLIPGLCKLATAELRSCEAEDSHIYNFGGGEIHTLNEVIGIIELLLQRRVAVVKHPPRTFDVPISLLCIEKAKKDLDWTPKVQLETGMGRMIADLREDSSRLFAG